MKTEGKSLFRLKQIFGVISDKIYFLVCPDNPKFHLQAVNMPETSLFKIVKENITNRNLFGSRDTSVTAASIIAT